MSRLAELIEELCPDGVEYRPLSELVRIRNGCDYKTLSPGSVPVYGSGGVMTHVSEALGEGPTVLIPRKGSLDNIFFVEGEFWTVDTIFYTEIASDLDPKFFYYKMKTMHLSQMNEAAGVPSMNQRKLGRIQIPVPPLEVQREIVRILDQFTTLEAELEAELEARRVQYEHYPNHSLSYDSLVVLTAGDGVGVGRVFHHVEGKYALHQRAYRIVPNLELLSSRYLYHVMVSQFGRYLESTVFHSSVTSVRKPMLERFPVAVPPMEEQDRVADVLDRFDALVNDISSGLPAEIAARRAQYEHYRDRLLSFPEKKAE